MMNGVLVAVLMAFGRASTESYSKLVVQPNCNETVRSWKWIWKVKYDVIMNTSSELGIIEL
ncbi:hypothetical protein Pan161_32000 [Gimesia algae]|uniref:Uncharacterized protein n=1 Tax=Gimesia algae TaxID=2527971 RepID=A0A517VEW1_9PLAN|nr:hypothetical protein Pan161_32000 [Gimesia algae]